jgi:hypothetical protein
VRTKLSKNARQLTNETQRKVILHADNTPPYITKSDMEFSAKLGPRVASHPLYSPHLTWHRTGIVYLARLWIIRRVSPFRQLCTFIGQANGGVNRLINNNGHSQPLDGSG